MGNARPRAEVLLTVEQAAELLAIPRSTLDRWRVEGNGPKFLQLSARCIRYRRSDIEAWTETRVRRSTSEYGIVEVEHG